MWNNIKKLSLVSLIAISLLGCQADGENPGVEYAPQMYHSVPYEPLSQIVEVPGGILSSRYYRTNSTPYNDYQGEKAINVRKPAPNTIPRQNYSSVTNDNDYSADQPLLIYDFHKDSIEAAAKVKNPVPKTDAVLKEGKKLYLAYCGHCHGEKGDGKGKVGEVYKGVANFQSRAVAAATEGHIFHVITHGRNRMWAHKSQLNPEERWKIVHYVQKLQKGEK